MDAIETLKQDVQAGRIGADRLVDLLVSLQRQVQGAHQQLQATEQQLQAALQQLQTAQQRIEELEKKLGGATAKVEEPFSVRAEEKRQEARGKKKRQPKQTKRRGRIPSKDKVAQAERTEAVFPEGVAPDACSLSHVRPVWRLEARRAVLVAYQIYRGPRGQYGKIPGVLGRSEFGLEIATEIAYLVYVMGLSFDKACVLLNFFQDLRLSKAQADQLLYRLSRHWEGEFEVLCTLLANSLVVHADETSWSINSVWAFLSEKARLLWFGVHKDAATLQLILDPETFAGLVISDDYAVYATFTGSQKCWAHLLRKAIAVTLKRFLIQVKRHHPADYDALPEELRQRYGVTQAQLLAKEGKDAAGRAKSRQQVAEDLRTLIDQFADHAGLRDRPSYQALVKVFNEQCEIVEDKIQVRSKTGGNCLQNPSDPEATYDGIKGQGYQLQISETCSVDNEVQLITSVLPQTAVESDANTLVPVLEKLQAQERLPEAMLADTAYGGDENVQAAAALGVDVISPVAGPTVEAAAPELASLTIDDFAYDERTGKVGACPTDRIPLQTVYDAANDTTTVHMSPEDCGNCPYRAQCPMESGCKTYTVRFTSKQRRLAGRRCEQATSEFRERYARRSGLESTNSGLKRRLGMDRLRVRGRKAVYHALY